MNHRCDYEMLSTTNSLEATHGHLNKKTPPKNDFWSSINRLAKSLSIKEESFNKKSCHNFNHVKYNTIEICKTLDKRTMENQKEFYNSTCTHCFCSENKLTSPLLRTDIPCSHRIDNGAEFLECPYFKLNIDEEYDQLIESINPIDPEEEPLIENDEFYNSKEYAYKIIKIIVNLKIKVSLENS